MIRTLGCVLVGCLGYSAVAAQTYPAGQPHVRTPGRAAEGRHKRRRPRNCATTYRRQQYPDRTFGNSSARGAGSFRPTWQSFGAHFDLTGRIATRRAGGRHGGKEFERRICRRRWRTRPGGHFRQWREQREHGSHFRAGPRLRIAWSGKLPLLPASCARNHSAAGFERAPTQFRIRTGESQAGRPAREGAWFETRLHAAREHAESNQREWKLGAEFCRTG